MAVWWLSVNVNVNGLIRKPDGVLLGEIILSYNRAFRTCSVRCYACPTAVLFMAVHQRTPLVSGDENQSAGDSDAASATSCQTSVTSRTNIIQQIVGDAQTHALRNDGNRFRVIDHIQGHVRCCHFSSQGMVQRVRSCHSLSAKLATGVQCRSSHGCQ